MSEPLISRHGGRVLADQLRIQGVDTIFGVPGESFLALLDGLYEHRNAIRVVTTRQEGGASNMADAYAKLTGKVGVCTVTRGPGATNASVGIHTAFQDSTPVLLLIGQVGRDMTDREAFQEVDYRRMFGEMAKWVAQVDTAERIPEYISHAFHVAQAGRPGPVVLALPEDMLREVVEVADAPPAHVVQAAPGADAMADLRAHLVKAERPLLMLGGPTWTSEAVGDMQKYAEANGLPVTVSLRAQDCFDNRHDHYVGDVAIGINPKLAQRVRDCDLLIVAGPRLGEMTTSGYELVGIPNPEQTLIHIHPGAEELGRVYAPALAINSGMAAFAAAAAALEPVDGSAGADWRAQVRAEYEAHIQPTEVPGAVNLGQVMAYLNENTPEDTVLTGGAGNYTVWVHRFFQHKVFRSQLAPTSGAMGYGFPAAIAAKLAAPERMVINVSGDGCFMMHGQELATAVQYGANVICIIANNGMLGTIRMHQERRYPGRTIATDLQNPDFAAFAKAFGAHGETVERTDDFPAAFDRAVKCGKPAVIELLTDAEAITPKEKLSGLAAAQ